MAQDDVTPKHLNLDVANPTARQTQQVVSDAGLELVAQLRILNARQLAQLVGTLGVMFGVVIIVGLFWAATNVQEHHLAKFSYSPLLNISLGIVVVSLALFSFFWARAEWKG